MQCYSTQMMYPAANNHSASTCETDNCTASTPTYSSSLGAMCSLEELTEDAIDHAMASPNGQGVAGQQPRIKFDDNVHELRNGGGDITSLIGRQPLVSEPNLRRAAAGSPWPFAAKVCRILRRCPVLRWRLRSELQKVCWIDRHDGFAVRAAHGGDAGRVRISCWSKTEQGTIDRLVGEKECQLNVGSTKNQDLHWVWRGCTRLFSWWVIISWPSRRNSKSVGDA